MSGPGTDPTIRWGHLRNGLGYGIIENRAAPMVGSVAIVHGGSGNEDWATQGASHFLEHLLFNGTESRTQEEIYAEIDLLGAYNNATTRATHVAYLLVAPRERFWDALEVQADMLFHSVLPPEKLEKERGIILEELNRSIDSRTHDTERALQIDLFGPEGYGMPTLGSPTSIRTLTRDQILAFYNEFYSPNRVTWLLIGDLDAASAVDSLEARVGAVPGRGAPREPAPRFDSRAPRTRIHHLPVESPLVQWSWIFEDPASAEFVLARARFELLAAGSETPLGRRCLETWPGEVAGYAGYLSEYPGFSVATVRLDLSPGAPVSEILEGFSGLLAEAQADPVDPSAVEAWRTREETGELYLREKPHYYGILRGDLIAARGLVGWTANLPAVQSVTAPAVAAEPPPLPWPAGRISVVLPEGSSALRRGEEAGAVAASGSELSRWTLENGAEVAALTSPDSPVLAVHLFVRDRSRREPGGRAGIAELAHSLLGRATRSKDPTQVALSLGRIGAELKTADSPAIPYDDFYTSPDFSYVRFQSLDRYAPEALGLLAEILGDPGFPEAEFQQAKGAALRRVAQAQSSSRETARRRLEEFLHPEAGGGDLFGTEESLSPIGVEELAQFVRRYLDPRSFLFVLASSLPPDRLRTLTEATLGRIAVPHGPPAVPPLGTGPPTGRPDAAELGARVREFLDPSDDRWRRLFSGGDAVSDARRASLVLLADSVGGAQATLSLVRIFAAPESLRPALTVANGILSDRLAQQLRETEGLAYSIGSGLAEEAPGTWVWTASAGTSRQNLPRMLEGFEEAPAELLRRPPDAAEVERTAARIYGRGLMRRATRINWAYAAGSAILAGTDPAGLEDREASLRRVTPEEVVEAVRSYWRPGPGVVVVAY